MAAFFSRSCEVAYCSFEHGNEVIKKEKNLPLLVYGCSGVSASSVVYFYPAFLLLVVVV